MRVMIICSSLEKGRDGVGDYSRKLGGWLKNRGIEVHLLAVNDKHVEDDQVMDGNCIRLKQATFNKKKKTKIQNYIGRFNPDVIFLQYVPYAYHSKGMPLKFARVMGSLKIKADWIIMVHEPYIGGKLTAKGKFVQFAQQKALKRLIKKTAPTRVYTSIRKYQDALTEINILSSILPLFGNIEFTQDDRESKMKGNQLRAVYFGAPPAKENYHVIKDGLLRALSGYSLRLTLCGKINSSDFIQYLDHSFKDENIELENIGELQEKELSKLFSLANFGIARVSPDLIGKSGSAISLLEHGLKLWIPLAESQADIEKEVVFRPELCFYNLAELLADTSEPEKISNLDKVGKMLLIQLNPD